MRRKNNSHQQDIDDLKRQNTVLEQQSKFFFVDCQLIIDVCFIVRTLERARTSGNFDDGPNELAMENVKSDISSHESSDENEEDDHERRNKRVKTNAY